LKAPEGFQNLPEEGRVPCGEDLDEQGIVFLWEVPFVVVSDKLTEDVGWPSGWEGARG